MLKAGSVYVSAIVYCDTSYDVIMSVCSGEIAGNTEPWHLAVDEVAKRKRERGTEGGRGGE